MPKVRLQCSAHSEPGTRLRADQAVDLKAEVALESQHRTKGPGSENSIDGTRRKPQLAEQLLSLAHCRAAGSEAQHPIGARNDVTHHTPRLGTDQAINGEAEVRLEFHYGRRRHHAEQPVDATDVITEPVEDLLKPTYRRTGVSTSQQRRRRQ